MVLVCTDTNNNCFPTENTGSTKLDRKVKLHCHIYRYIASVGVQSDHQTSAAIELLQVTTNNQRQKEGCVFNLPYY